MIAYSIRAALDSQVFSDVLVSTEDEEIATIARSLGATVPFLRSQHNASDTATTTEVLIEVLQTLKPAQFEYLCCLYATAPFISPQRLKEGYELLIQTDADSVIPVKRFDYPIQRSLALRDGQLQMFWPENYSKRSQDLEPAYHDSGQFYFAKTAPMVTQNRLFLDKTVPLILTDLEVQDIDTEEDWEIAERKMKWSLERA